LVAVRVHTTLRWVPLVVSDGALRLLPIRAQLAVAVGVGVFVGVFVMVGVFVRVGVFDGVYVFVGVLAGVLVDGRGVLVAVGGIGVLVAVGGIGVFDGVYVLVGGSGVGVMLATPAPKAAGRATSRDLRKASTMPSRTAFRG
jgi:hypothetical protein